MYKWSVKRRLKTYRVEATTRSKAKYAAYKIYCKFTKNPMSFKDFFLGIKKVAKND